MTTTATAVSFTGYTAHDQHALDTAETVLLAVSPFNGFYSSANLTTVVTGAVQRFRRVFVALTGPESALRFIAAGTPPRTAVRRVISAVHKQRQVASATLARAGDPDPEQHVLVWTRFASQARYRTLRRRIAEAYHTVAQVHAVIDDMVRDVLPGDLGSQPPACVIEANAAYVFAEAPLLIDSPSLLGCEQVVFAYHRPMPLVELLTQNVVADLTPVAGQTFARVSTPERT